MSTYELYLLLHVGGAIVWIGAAFTTTLLATRAAAADDRDRMLALVRDGDWLGLRLFLPANLVVLASALLLVHEGGWSYDPLWIRLGVLGFAASFLTGALVFAPGWRRVGRLAHAEGPDDPRVAAAARRLLLGSWLDVGWLAAVVLVMTVKPVQGEWGALASAAALPVACVLVAAVLLPRAAPTAEAAS